MIGRWSTSQVEEEEQPTGFDSYEVLLGDVMRGERATLGKSLLDVQRELKIKANYIAAIENSDPSAFASQGFIAGYVRSYARYLGLDPEWAYSTFCREAGFEVDRGNSKGLMSEKKAERNPEYRGDPLSNPQASWVPKKESVFTGVEPGAIGSISMLLLLIGGLGYGGWAMLKEVQRVDFAPIEQTPGVLSELPDFGAATPNTITDETELASAAGLNTPPSVEALDRLYRPQALEVPVLTHRDAPISTLNPNSVGALAGLQTPSLDLPEETFPESATRLAAASGAGATVPESGVQVLGADAADVAVFAVRPSWVRIQAADGSVIFEKILDAGEHYVLPKTEQAPVLRSGNAGSVYFAVNGAAYGPAGDGPSVVKNVALSQEAVLENFALADLEGDADLATVVVELQATE
ncbi:helix-turn-helix domain-containing protein [Aliiroseovarius sp. F20344]|uniref:helix-turn-helix domain-containing protein n=1 Tax=Aliiroseovarius sp. F20344 TaxID=2926414 RepID=UPI001FF66332|nr:helix-turn-helix domain-containing protein [Aliiroseovarius sp. F20344]MCK0143337.1 helix-turn-helix domain-containing protein [Aliiroseovarius sp. F20344]